MILELEAPTFNRLVELRLLLSPYLNEQTCTNYIYTASCGLRTAIYASLLSISIVEAIRPGLMYVYPSRL